MKAIQDHIKSAIKESGIGCYVEVVPFPGGSERNRLGCIEGIGNVLKEAKSLKLINGT